MGSIREDDVEIRSAPVFGPGERVRARCLVRNDGTHPRSEIGAPLVAEGDVGFVRDIGTFLQRYWIYAVEWPERGLIVGMRGRELTSLDRPEASEPAAVERDPAADSRSLPERCLRP